MNRFVLLTRVLYLFLFFCAFRWVRNAISFERYLDTLYITFDDFPKDYSKALVDSKAKDIPLEYDYGANFPAPDADKYIPPIIHFIWFKDLYETRHEVTEIPSQGSQAPEHCRNANPDFKVELWNATAGRDLLEQHYAWFLPTYDSYPHPIQRVDAIKYFVLWHYGGVYMDLDIGCRRSLAPLLPFPAWFPEASPLGVNNDLMASRAHHPAIGLMIENLARRNKNLIFPYLTVFWSTGPQFTSDLLKKWFNEKGPGTFKPGDNKSKSDPDQFYVLPQVFYSEEYTFFGHSPGGTWHGSDVAVVLWLVDRPGVVLFLASSLVLMCLAVAFRRRFRRKTKLRSPKIGSALV